MDSSMSLTHWKRLWCWEGLGAGGEGDNRGWDGLMASLTRWMWVSVNSWSWWWTGWSGVLRFMGSQRVGHDWATELNWTEVCVVVMINFSLFVRNSTLSSSWTKWRVMVRKLLDIVNWESGYWLPYLGPKPVLNLENMSNVTNQSLCNMSK